MSYPQSTDVQLLESAVTARLLDMSLAMEALLEAAQAGTPVAQIVDQKLAASPLAQQRWRRYVNSESVRADATLGPNDVTGVEGTSDSISAGKTDQGGRKLFSLPGETVSPLPPLNMQTLSGVPFANPQDSNQEAAPVDNDSGIGKAVLDSADTDLSAAMPDRVPLPTASDLSSQSNPPAANKAAESASAENQDRYQLREEIGRGGCGVVYRAYDKQLQRDVVVKQLQHNGMHLESIAERFFYEAKLTGRLTHPGIVPVYELGEASEDGSPFYAMKWLQGETLSEAIKSYHELPNGAEKQRRLHELLESFIQVCQTIAYAHQRGIIHRDLKPANIMLGAFGETIVLDWGLGKELTGYKAIYDDESSLPDWLTVTSDDLTGRIGDSLTIPADPREAAHRDANLNQQEPLTTPNFKDLGTLTGSEPINFDEVFQQAHVGTHPRHTTVLDESDSPDRTRQGMVLGTAAYMAPEQALGKWDEVDRRSDIFSLGVVLSEILLGRSPLRAEDVPSTIARVVRGEYRPIRTMNRRIPKPLAAICDQAMAHQAIHRYSDAQELARDLQRYLAGEAVQAYREPIWGRADRLLRRNRTLAWSGLLSGAVISIMFVVAYLSIHASHRHEQMARFAAEEAWERERRASRQAQEANALAMEQLRAAREAGDAWLIDLSQQLAQLPQLEVVQADLQQNAREHFRKLTKKPSDLPSYQLEVSLAHLRMGDLLRMEDDHITAARHYELALQGLQDLKFSTPQQHPDDPANVACDSDEICMAIANAHLGLALLELETDRLVEKQSKHANLAVGQLENLSPNSQHEPDTVAAYIRAALISARGKSQQGELDAAIHELEAYQQDAWNLATRHDRFRYRRLWEILMTELSALYEETGQTALHRLTLKRHREGLFTLSERTGSQFNIDRWQADLALELGESYRNDGRWKESLQEYDQAVAHLDCWLQAQEPPVEWWERANAARTRRAISATACGKRLEAEADLRMAISGWRSLISAKGADSERAAELATAYLQLGQILSDKGSSEAEACFANVLELADFVIDNAPQQTNGFRLKAWGEIGMANFRRWQSTETPWQEPLSLASQVIEDWSNAGTLSPGEKFWLQGLIDDTSTRLSSNQLAQPDPVSEATIEFWAAAVAQGELPYRRLATEQLLLRILTQESLREEEAKQADELSETFLQHSPNSPAARRFRAWYLWRMQEPDEAWQQLSAVSNFPNSPSRLRGPNLAVPTTDVLLASLILRDLDHVDAPHWLEAARKRLNQSHDQDWVASWLARQLGKTANKSEE